MIINYKLLSEAIWLYKEYGYEFIDVPWMVHPLASLATNPPEGGIFILEDGRHLVGSAEQGFIQIINELEPNRKYAAITPCFRQGDNRDEYHQETFMKLELFSYCNGELNDNLVKMHKHHARNVAILLGIDPTALSFNQETETNCDLEVNIGKSFDLEIGSYGYRTFGETHIVYGTGLALPRFEQALREHVYES